MANKQEIVKILGVIAAAYPNFTLLPETVVVYSEMLADLDAELLGQAAKAHLVTGKFFPTIAELREAIAGLIERACNLPTASAAWGEVLEKIKRYGNTLLGGSVPEFSSPVIAKVVRSLGWNELCSSENEIADRARFLQAFETEARRAHQDLQFLPETHQFVQSLGPGNTVASEIKSLTDRLSISNSQNGSSEKMTQLPENSLINP